MPVDRSVIRVKAMLIAPNEDLSAHVVSLNTPTAENPDGYHRLIGGSVELGESHRDAIVREVHEELGATVHDLTHLEAVEDIFQIDGGLGHEIVFLYSGRLDPLPATVNATLTEVDGSVVPVVWRSLREDAESLPLYPTAALSWVHHLPEQEARNRGRQPDAAARPNSTRCGGASRVGAGMAGRAPCSLHAWRAGPDCSRAARRRRASPVDRRRSGRDGPADHPGLSQQGADRFTEIGETARTALTEMRRLLGVLREDAATERMRHPQPGIAEISGLVDEARDKGGSRIRLEITGDPPNLDAGTQLTAYRIVQEALTNARRHAPGAAVSVLIRFSTSGVAISVEDDGPGGTVALSDPANVSPQILRPAGTQPRPGGLLVPTSTA